MCKKPSKVLYIRKPGLIILKTSLKFVEGNQKRKETGLGEIKEPGAHLYPAAIHYTQEGGEGPDGE